MGFVLCFVRFYSSKVFEHGVWGVFLFIGRTYHSWKDETSFLLSPEDNRARVYSPMVYWSS